MNQKSHLELKGVTQDWEPLAARCGWRKSTVALLETREGTETLPTSSALSDSCWLCVQSLPVIL